MIKRLIILAVLVTATYCKGAINTNFLMTGQEITNAILAMLATNIYGITNISGSNVFITNPTSTFTAGDGVRITTNTPHSFTLYTTYKGIGSNIVVTVSSRGLANSLAAVTNDGAMFGPDTPSTTTMGIQEAILSLPSDAAHPDKPGGGKILLGEGTFYTTSTITNKGGTNVFSLTIEGPGITAGGIVGVGNHQVLRLTHPQVGQTFILTIRDMYLASTSVLTNKVLYLNGWGDSTQSGGIGRARIEMCYFGQWTKMTNNNVVYDGRGWFTPSTTGPTNLFPNNLVGLDIEGNWNDMVTVEKCSFNFLAGIAMRAPHSTLRQNMFEHCGMSGGSPTNQWGKNYYHSIGGAVTITGAAQNENSDGWVGPGPAQNLDYMDISANKFVDCRIPYVINVDSPEKTIRITDNHFEYDGNPPIFVLNRGLITFDNSVTLVPYVVYLLTNFTDHPLYALSNPTLTNSVVNSGKTNGITTSGTMWSKSNITLFATSSNLNTVSVTSSNLQVTNIQATAVLASHIQASVKGTPLGSNNAFNVYNHSQFFTTNSAAAAVVMRPSRQLIVASGNVTLTGPVAPDGTNEQSIVIYINPNGTDRVLTIPTAWRTTDGLRSYVVGTTNIGVINIECYAGQYTNAAFVNLW